MNRADFQRLAEVRLREAESLLAAGLWDGAYYLAGYAVECGLKACIAKRTRAEDFPPDRKFVELCYSHDFDKLLLAADLAVDHKTARDTDATLERNWAVVKDWSEQARYRLPSAASQARAERLMSALTAPAGGVLPWITQRW